MEVGLMQLQYTAMQSGIGLAIVSSTVTGHSVLRFIKLRLWSSPGYRLYLRIPVHRRYIIEPIIISDLPPTLSVSRQLVYRLFVYRYFVHRSMEMFCTTLKLEVG